MLRVHPLDEIQNRVGATSLPSGTEVEIQTYKRNNDTVDLSAIEAQISAILVDNDLSIGAYPHGDRFIAFIDGEGGMEYSGATTRIPCFSKRGLFFAKM